MKSPRRVAQDILLGREKGRVRLEGDALDELPADDRRVAHELVLGVRRRLFLLDAILRGFVKEPIGKIAPPLREALRLGTYDLLFRERVPAAVVVAETVDLAGPHPRRRGFLNAVLRKLATAFEVVTEEPAVPDRHHVFAAPGRFLRFAQPVLPDPLAQPAKALSTHYSVTEWFAAGLLDMLPLEAEAFLSASVAKLPVALRPTAKAGSLDALRARLEAEGCTVLGAAGGVLEIHSETPLGELPSLRENFCVVQDATAAEVAPFLAPEAGERILDLCAPPGGKTLHLAELMRNQGEIVAAHVGAERAARLVENIGRAQASIVKPWDLGEDGKKLPPGRFDRVLVDAPCTNSGVLMKRVDARFRLHPKEVERLAELQGTLLQRALRAVRDGGVVVYSTCSVLPSENHALVRRIVRENPGTVLEEERLRYPHRTGRDGGYLARLRARAAPPR